MQSEEQKFLDDLLKQVFPGAELRCGFTEKEGRDKNTFRRIIRQKLTEDLEKLPLLLSAEEKDRLSDLEKVPHLDRASFSISHSDAMACWIFTKKPLRLGVDIEDENRVTVAAVQRIASPDEMSLAPSPAALWSAKEAVFKALNRSEDLRVVSQIETRQWLPLGKNSWIFTAKCGEKNFPQGLSVAFKGFQLAVFVESP